MRDLGQMLTEYCTQWKDIGAQLGLSSALLRVIDADNTKQRECFRETLQKWLQMDTKATWHKLELAITNATRGSGALPKLSSSKLQLFIANGLCRNKHVCILKTCLHT